MNLLRTVACVLLGMSLGLAWLSLGTLGYLLWSGTVML